MRGFSDGFKSAWGSMLPFVTESISRGKETLRSQAVEETRVHLMKAMSHANSKGH